MEKKASGISFGLSKTTRRPGLAKPNLTEEEIPTGPIKKKPLVIPLIQSELSPPVVTTLPSTEESPPPPSSASLNESSYGLQLSKKKQGLPSSSTVPLLGKSSPLFRRKDDKGLRVTLSDMPDEPMDASYERVPVEEFGAALLRGMGWTDGGPIGRNASKVVKPYEPKQRPKGLGLGATSSKSHPQSQPELVVGKSVSIIRGDHIGLHGVITKVGSILHVQLTSGVIVEVDRSEISFTEINNNLLITDEDPLPIPGPSWIHPHIRIRIKSKVLASGGVYRKIGDILDTTMDEDGIERAVLRLEDGRIISGVHQGQIEPIRPTIMGTKAIIIKGPQQGLLGRVISISKDECHIQLDDSFDVCSIPIDNLCEYI